MGEGETTAVEVKDFLDGQLELYRQVLALSQAQLAAIKGGNTAVMMEVLAKKQELISKIDIASAASASTLTRWETQRHGLSAEIRDPVTAAHESLKGVLAEVISLEDEAKSHIANTSNSNGQQIVTLQKGKQMLKAYGSAPPRSAGRFTDNRK